MATRKTSGAARKAVKKAASRKTTGRKAPARKAAKKTAKKAAKKAVKQVARPAAVFEPAKPLITQKPVVEPGKKRVVKASAG